MNWQDNGNSNQIFIQLLVQTYVLWAHNNGWDCNGMYNGSTQLEC